MVQNLRNQLSPQPTPETPLLTFDYGFTLECSAQVEENGTFPEPVLEIDSLGDLTWVWSVVILQNDLDYLSYNWTTYLNVTTTKYFEDWNFLIIYYGYVAHVPDPQFEVIGVFDDFYQRNDFAVGYYLEWLLAINYEGVMIQILCEKES